MLGLTINVWLAFLAVYFLLGLGVIALFGLRARHPGRLYTELSQRIQSWWVMVTVLVAAIVAGAPGVIALFAFVSFLALREYLSIVPSRREDRLVVLLSYFIIPANYALIAANRYGIFLVFVPIYVFVFFPFVLVCIGQVKRFLSFMGALHWGHMTAVYNISHVAVLMMLPESRNPKGGDAGLVVFLLALTALNDVAQYIWGKLIGGPKIVPSVSPNKTLAGFLGGVATTVLVSWLVAPYLTPLSFWTSLLMGAVVAVAGFAGDVTISAVKRDLGLKDTSNLIPGHGGILDRVDSLTFTAPLFFHILYFFHY